MRAGILGFAAIALFSVLESCGAVPLRRGNFTTNEPIYSLDDVDNKYDYIIVGGGTAGLTVADRLTEDESKSVLVVEFGDIVDDDPELKMPQKGNPFPTQYMFNISSVPQTALNSRVGTVQISAIAGGGSAINAMFHDRGSVADYDAWVELGNDGWGWNDLLPYFKKAVEFTPPDAFMQEEFGITYNEESAYGGHGPVDVSYPPFQWEGLKTQWDAWGDLGIEAQVEGADGTAYGRIWVPSSQDPVNETRVDAVLAHYKRVAEVRPNYNLLLLHKVTKVELNGGGNKARGVTVESRESGETKMIEAQKEVIMAAGAIHTPQILQLSGIGPSSVLEAAGIDVVVDHPGVGQNFHNHPWFVTVFNYTTNFYPNPDTLTSNETFAAEAYEEYWANKTGPYSLGLGNAGVFLPLSDVTGDYQLIAADYADQAPSDYLATDTPPEVVAGYAAQQAILATLFASDEAAVLEMPLAGGSTSVTPNLKPTSRGSVAINPADPSAEPLVDYRAWTNPTDARVMVEMLKRVREYHAVPAMVEAFHPVELVPGPDVATDDEIEQVMRTQLLDPDFFHPVGTAAMMPLENGGVVGTDLLVYGVRGLSVVDASVIPMIPGTHMAETVYAIAEKVSSVCPLRACIRRFR
ncbi:glucose-methanol-choline oxidoreductase [Lineolata rhizophorae]|uniref:Glucose-methanol-choline oxidoreductase n=1 Tax=Lineolata rhizophorae TaxID=578093 RepID=A0A6A6PB78_9PEZI|nr:glucose-methanol-choline oxidoreductase [Lineolata rhizophorae]